MELKFWKISFCVLLACMLFSCDIVERDGDWDPMLWEKVDYPKSGEVYQVPASGSTLTFSCLNYSRYWFSHAKEDGQEVLPPYIDYLAYPLIYGDYFRAEIHDNKLSIVFEPNEGAHARNTYITVTAGDIFHTFKFTQAAQ